MARCRYCWKHGHNQRTCAVKTEQLKNRATAAIERGETDSWVVKQYNERISTKKGKSLSNQQCSYCGTYGHTRRKCETLEKDKAFYVEHHNMIVKVAHDYIVQSPVGIGSLFNQTTEEWSYEAARYVTKNTKLVAVGFGLSSDLLTNEPSPLIVLQDIATGKTVSRPLRYFVRGETDGRYNNKVELITPVAGVIPSGWVEKHSTSVEAVAKTDKFKRVGKKYEDQRVYTYQMLEDCRKRVADPDSWGHINAVNLIEKWSHDSIRAALFEDYKKNG